MNHGMSNTLLRAISEHANSLSIIFFIPRLLTYLLTAVYPPIFHITEMWIYPYTFQYQIDISNKREWMKQDLLINRAKGALLGLAVGDALGTTLECQSRPNEPVIKGIVGGGPFKLRAGEWTDDTSMMLCLADSLIDCNRSDPVDQMKRYIAWRDDGYQSCTGTCFDIGSIVARALDLFEETGSAFACSTSEYSAGNGSLMRVAPVALFSHHQPLHIAMSLAAESSITTHGEQRCIDACRYMIFLIHTLLTVQTQGVSSGSTRALDLMGRFNR